jgi:hypothetical protein
MDSNFHLAHGINPKTLKGSNIRTVANNVFKADFHPPFPNIENPFIATEFAYASLSEGSFSLIGRIPHPEVIQQFAFVVPCSTEDGTHKIVEMGDGIWATFITGYVGIIKIEKGEITFKRDKVQNTIEATFRVYIKHQHEQEPIDEYLALGTVFLNATGPLCGER